METTKIVEGEKLQDRKMKCHPPTQSWFCAFLQALADFDICIKEPGSASTLGQSSEQVAVDRAAFFFVNSLAAMSQSSACVHFLGCGVCSAVPSL